MKSRKIRPFAPKPPVAAPAPVAHAATRTRSAPAYPQPVDRNPVDPNGRVHPEAVRSTPGEPTIFTLSRADAEAMVPRPDDVCISIASPNERYATLPAGFADVLQLAFPDRVYDAPDPETACPLSREDAERILRFAERAQSSAGRIVVHCGEGVSRSHAVAEALARVFGAKLYTRPGRLHNRPVFLMLARLADELDLGR